MLDTYCEYIVRRKKGVREFLKVTGITFLALILLFIVPNLISMVPIISFLSPLSIAGIIYLAYRLIVRNNIEFEYTLTGSDLDIDKIMNRAARKRVISVVKSEIDIVAPVGSSYLPSLENVEIIDASSHNADAKVYVMTINKETKKAIYFEPNENMISNLKERNPKKVFTE